MSGSQEGGEGEKKSSKAWLYFTDLNHVKENRAKCNYCDKVISYKGGGPYNLIRHTKSQHPLVFVAIKETQDSQEKASPPSTSDVTHFDQAQPSESSEPTKPSQPNSESSEPTKPSQPSESSEPSQPSQATFNQVKNVKINQQITDFLPKPLTNKKTETLNKLLVKLFTKNYLPFALVESPDFKEFVKQLNPNYKLPSRKTLSNVLVDKYYNITKQEIKAELADSDHIALTTDGWSSDPNENYVGLTAHFINKEADLKAYTLECAQYSDRHTAENLAQQLRKICEDWEISNKVVSVSTDNANNIKAAIRLTGWKQISCFAHSLNLVVQNALNAVKATHLKVKRIVELFKRSPLACERLKTMQQKLGEPVLKIKQDVVTRWNSTCDMFERVLEVKNSLQSTLYMYYPDTTALTSEDLDVLKGATEILRVFKAVSEEMSSERSVTISEVVFITNELKNQCMEHLADDSLPETVHALVFNLHDELEKRFSGIQTDSVMLESTLLDPRLKKHGFDDDLTCERAYSYLKASAEEVHVEAVEVLDPSPPSDSTEDMGPPLAKKSCNIWQRFDLKLSELAKTTSPTSGVQRELNNYFEEPLLARTQNPLKWWLNKKSLYPRLYSMATKRLCIPATSVPSERIFSKAGQMITERRNRLTGKKVNKLIFLNNNL